MDDLIYNILIPVLILAVCGAAIGLYLSWRKIIAFFRSIHPNQSKIETKE